MPVPVPGLGPVNGVRCHCTSVSVGNLYSYSVGAVARNGNLSAHLLMRLALLCVASVTVGHVKLIYNFPASHFNFSCCQQRVLFAFPFQAAPLPPGYFYSTRTNYVYAFFSRLLPDSRAIFQFFFKPNCQLSTVASRFFYCVRGLFN